MIFARFLSLMLSPRFLTVLALGATATGCFDSTTSNRAVVTVRWAAPVGNTCGTAGIASVHVRLTSLSGINTDLSGLVCDSYSQSVSVPGGTYSITVDGLDGTNQVITTGGPITVNAPNGLTTLAPIVTLGASTGGASAVAAAWTIAGQPASSACGALGLSTVKVLVLDKDKKTPIGSVTVACSAGQAVVSNLSPGSSYLEIDAMDASGAIVYGNNPVYGPFNIQSGVTTSFQTAFDLVPLSTQPAANTAVSLDWIFADNGTCASHNVDNVLVQVEDANGQIVVAMTDPDASKPCNMAAGTTKQRVIDMKSVNSTCIPPVDAKSLYICNITGTSVGLHVTTVDKQTGQYLYGGSMQVKQLVAGTHTAIQTPLSLSACGGANTCSHP